MSAVLALLHDDVSRYVIYNKGETAVIINDFNIIFE